MPKKRKRETVVGLGPDGQSRQIETSYLGPAVLATQPPPIHVYWPRYGHRKEKPDRRYWPEDKPLPAFHAKPAAMPCPKCRRVLTDLGGRAVVLSHSGADLSYFRCKVCDHRWSLPVKEE